MKVGVETSGRQELWGTLEEVLEVVNHVEGTIPVLNMAHIHARGHGRLKTSEDYGELFDQVRTSIGTKTFYCHFSGVEHRMGNALHYTQIKKSDLNFEPLAEFLIEEGDWLDVTIISDSPLLEHDAMYMMQHIERSRHKQLERKAREDRRRALAAQAGMSPEEMEAREKAEKEKRLAAQNEAAKAELEKVETPVLPKAEEKEEKKPEKKPEKKAPAKKGAAKKGAAKKGAAKKDEGFFEETKEDDDLF